MRLGVAVGDTWSFFNEVYDELQAHHDTHLFSRRKTSLPAFNTRVNRRLLDRDLRAFLGASDVAFFEWASELLAEASRLPKTCGIVTRLHRYELYRWADKINWNAVDRVILVSEAKRREFAARFPDQAGKLVVIPEALDLSRFTFAPRSFRGDIGTLCHLKPRKRVYELILAFSDLAAERSDLHLHIGGGKAAGFEEYSEALFSLVRRLELEDRVTFHDGVSEPQDWYRQIDIFVSNSYSEGLQLAPMEAMASGCYTLSHWWDGADELLPASQLYFTERELRQKILEYAALGGECQSTRLAEQRRIVEERFDVSRTSVELRRVVEAVAENRRVWQAANS